MPNHGDKSEGMHRLLPATEQHAEKMNTLLCRALCIEGTVPSVPPQTAPLSFVLEGPNRTVEMACYGRIGTFAIFTPLADPLSFDSKVLAENLVLFLESALADLRKQNVCGIIVMVPCGLESLGEVLRQRGFASETATASYWKYLPDVEDATAQGSTPKPS